ncbi:MAG: hypothetical protein F4Z04_14435 [Acidobacteria bacterium]|nr:hypothetical protein [Acidobacteriota bacterium]
MDHVTVLEHLKRLHREIEVDDGNDPNAVRDDIFPLDDLSGFDSPLIPNVIRGLAKAVGLSLPKGVRLRNPYVGSGVGTRLTLRDVAKRFCELYGKEDQ